MFEVSCITCKDNMTATSRLGLYRAVLSGTLIGLVVFSVDNCARSLSRILTV